MTSVTSVVLPQLEEVEVEGEEEVVEDQTEEVEVGGVAVVETFIWALTALSNGGNYPQKRKRWSKKAEPSQLNNVTKQTILP
jgi:hypothetical protein